MVKHIVMFQLAKKTPENIQKVAAALRNLEGKIETLRYIEVGIDFSQGERSYDVVLTTHFTDKEGLKTYQAHEVHTPVVQLIRALCSSSVVVDFEI